MSTPSLPHLPNSPSAGGVIRAKPRRRSRRLRRTGLVLVLAALVGGPAVTQAKNQIRQAFFSVYPEAVGSRLDNLPSKSGHCGVCHYNFNGGGSRNPYGVAVQNNLNLGNAGAIRAIRTLDSDGDGFSSDTEVTNRLAYGNTPTFPGLTLGNLGQIGNAPVAEVEGYVVPSSAVDTTPPSVTVLGPNGGEVLTANRSTLVTWTANDASGIATVAILLSTDNGGRYEPIARGLGNSGSFEWFPANRPTSEARIRVVAEDGAGNTNADGSDAVFSIVSPPGGRVATTLRDFDMPGTQPFEGGGAFEAPSNCGACHGGYDPAVEPYANWQGSMMANASLDPLFQANLTIANQDAPESGDLCLRCHNYRGWVQGRSTPTDGRRMLPEDLTGVSCDMCHRLVDPIYTAGANPPEDQGILAALFNPGTNFANGMIVIDPGPARRGPVTDPVSPHDFRVSPFHREAALCGACHDVSNPAFERSGTGHYLPNALDAAATVHTSGHLLPVERTYSEWLHSAYNTPTGVHAPQFAGNKPDGRVATCQDCHMRDVAGRGCNDPAAPIRADLPLHDMTGGSTWLPGLLTNLHPGRVNAAAIQAGIGRAQYMLTHAASLRLTAGPGTLTVLVTNETGHKLPTGYPEGRRMWLNVQFYDAATNLLAESGAYDPATGILTHDAEARVYEVKPGIDTNIVNILTPPLPAGPSFHFVLNNTVFKDNRIPPRGFANAAFAEFGGAPVGHAYADGQYWDEAPFSLPPAATQARVRLYYQSTSKEFIEFLRDENRTDNRGDELHALWEANEKCPPVTMAEAEWALMFRLESVHLTGTGVCRITFLSRPGTAYTIEYADGLGGDAAWQPFANNGTLVATGTQSHFEDDFTANTSGSAPAGGTRFYRFSYPPAP